MAGIAEPAGSGGKGGTGITRGLVAGIAVLIIAIVFFTFFLMGNSGAKEPGCDETGTCTVPTLTTAAPTPVPVIKTARPTVELYVMSFCPFGVQVENVMKPVVTLLGNRTDFKVLYIATVPGTDLSTAKSLHGNAEAIEDARQICIMTHAPEKYWDYISTFNTKCYPVWKNETLFVACQGEVTDDLGITGTVAECVGGSEGFALLKADASMVRSAGITSSPTIMINGQKYTGNRTSESIKQAICDHFDTAPDACTTILSSEKGATSGSC